MPTTKEMLMDKLREKWSKADEARVNYIAALGEEDRGNTK